MIEQDLLILRLRSETTFEYRFELWLLVANPAIVDSFLLIDHREGIGEGESGKGVTSREQWTMETMHLLLLLLLLPALG